MNLICGKCRRLVRSSSIDKNNKNYYCGKCNKTYDIPKSFYLRDELDIPILASKTSLKVSKSEEELLIKLPIKVITLVFVFSILTLLFFTLYFLFFLSESEIIKTYQVVISSLVIFLIILLNATSKKSIQIKDNQIILIKRFFLLRLKTKVDLSDIKKIQKLEVEAFKGSNHVLSRCVEIEFKESENWELGHNLSKEDIDYIVAELKLYHFYSQANQ